VVLVRVQTVVKPLGVQVVVALTTVLVQPVIPLLLHHHKVITAETALK
jgi:hypothetical protein